MVRNDENRDQPMVWSSYVPIGWLTSVWYPHLHRVIWATHGRCSRRSEPRPWAWDWVPWTLVGEPRFRAQKQSSSTSRKSFSDLNDMSNIFEGLKSIEELQTSRICLVGIHIQIFFNVLKSCLPMESLRALQCSLLNVFGSNLAISEVDQRTIEKNGMNTSCKMDPY